MALFLAVGAVASHEGPLFGRAIFLLDPLTHPLDFAPVIYFTLETVSTHDDEEQSLKPSS